MASPNSEFHNEIVSSAPISPQSNLMSTSTKVVTLSRNQPMAYNYGTQNCEPGYRMENGQTTPSYGEMQYNNNMRPASAQPQIFTVGASPHSPNQNWQPAQPAVPYQQPPSHQQPQQFRVMTTPLQAANQNSSNIIYVGQSQQQQRYQQPYQNNDYYQNQPYQSHQQGQNLGQIVYARPANQVQTPTMAAYTPMMQQPNQNTVVYQTTNQPHAQSQPMVMQPGQQTYNQTHNFQHVPSSPSPQAVRYPVNQVQQVNYQTAGQQVPPQTKTVIYPQQAPYAVQSQGPIKPAQAYHQQQNYSGLPPPSPLSVTAVANHPTSTNQQPQLRARVPSTGGQSRQIKVKSLPMRNSNSCDNLDSISPPQFVVHPVEQITVNEGEPVNLTAVVRPAGDSSLQVEWYRNGKPLPASSRFTTTFDRGYAVLDFLYTNFDDSGDYFCVATNRQGQDQSGSSHVNILPEERVITDTQLPEESMIANLAMMEENLIRNEFNRTTHYTDDTHAHSAPTFLKALSSQVGLKEASPAHFETFVEPSNDPSLVLEWYKDDKPVTTGCRFNTVFDRGFALLDIHYCYPEDNGSYYCVAKNSAGQAQSNVVELQCNAEEGIVTNSVLSKESISYLQSLDSWSTDQMAGYDSVRQIDEEQEAAPTFDILPVALTVTEGSPARFLVKAGGYPRPKVYWFINGDMMASQGGCGNWRIYQDGGISYLEFHRVGNPAKLDLRVVAKNKLGEASAETTMTIEPQQDFRPDLRHVAPENPFKRLALLRKVQCSNELSSALRKPKAQAMDLRCLERELEHKGRLAANSDVIEAENMYSRVQAQLRTSRRSSQPPPGEMAARNSHPPPPPQQQQQQPIRQPQVQQQQQQQRPAQAPAPRPPAPAPAPRPPAPASVPRPPAPPTQQQQQQQQQNMMANKMNAVAPTPMQNQVNSAPNPPAPSLGIGQSIESNAIMQQ